jgi:hypothetical protein
MSENATIRQNRVTPGLVVLLAVVLVGGTIGSWVYRSLRQKELVAAIQADLAYAQYRYMLDDNFYYVTGATPPGPAWLRERLGIDFFDTVIGVESREATNAKLATFAKFPALRVLCINVGGHVDDDGIEQLKDLRSLEAFYASSCPITARGLAVLAGLPHLRILGLRDCDQIDDAGFDEISKASNLTRLNYSNGKKVTTAGLAKLSRRTKLESLNLIFHPGATDAVLEDLQSLSRLRVLALNYEAGGLAGGLKYLGSLSSLEELSLSGDVDISDADLAAIPSLSQLRRLSVVFHEVHVSSGGLANFKRLSNLCQLILMPAPQIDDAAIADIAALPRLEYINLPGSDSELTDAALESIGKMSSLRQIAMVLSRHQTDAGLKHLEGLKGMRILSLRARTKQFSPEVVAALKAALPKSVEYSEFSPPEP